MKYKRILVLLLIGLFLVGSLQAEYIPFKVKLNALERFIIGVLLPKEASFAQWKIYNDLKNQLSFTDEESIALELQPAENGGVKGKWFAIPEKEITFGEIAEKYIMETLKDLDSKGKLLSEHIPLYEKFVLRGKDASL